jgi:hypothetical protein
MSQFDVIFEKELERFQTGGYCVGDRIRFRSDALKHEYVKSRAQSFQDIVKTCSEPSFDLNLRIGAIKSIYPTTTQNYGNGTESPAGLFVDVYIEYAPGLFRNPMTVPIEVIEDASIRDEGRGPIPDSLRRKNNIHGPEQIKTDSDIKANVNLTDKNVQLPGANKWDDTQPGGGNFKPKR